MSKNKKALKRKRNDDPSHAAAIKKKTSPASTMITQTTTTATTADPLAATTGVAPRLSALVSEEEVDITVDTLRSLAENPAYIKTKGCKELRTAVYDFSRACTTGVNASVGASLAARVEAALVDDKHVDALVLLAEMRIRGDTPKLGTLCRWVRHLDAVSGLSMRNDGDGANQGDSANVGGDNKLAQTIRTPRQCLMLRALDAILRVMGTTDLHPELLSPLDASGGPLALQKLWDLRDPDWSPVPVRDVVMSGKAGEWCPDGAKSKFEVLETTPGPQRKPPNLHDAVLYLTQDGTVPLSRETPSPPATLHRHPQVPNLSLVKDVLSRDECKAIIGATESVGFLPDAPIRDGDGGVDKDSTATASSILAHNVYWVIDQAFHDTLWERVRGFLPTDVDGRRARGINRRFRVYRYVPGAEYRCHVDGAWPPSGVVDAAPTRKYLYDASPADDKQSSLFTFLLYLNDEFDGGETTFFTPSPRDGVMNAHPVRPVMGSVALFPHGETSGTLLHEGTGVRKGAKYIIRTDVEYDVVPSVAA